MNNHALILIVEDNHSMRRGLCATLDIIDFGYEHTALTAVDGFDALEQMRTIVPDLIISDVMMPRMNGFKLLEKVRANPAWNHIPFIFLSARGSREEIWKGQLSGADRYIAKPFRPDELALLMRNQLDRAKQIQAQRTRDMKELQASILQLLNHEFRTPLTYVTAYYEMLADSLNQSSNAEFHEYLQGIEAGSRRLTRLVEDFIRLLDLRKPTVERDFAQQAVAIDALPEVIRRGVTAGEQRQRQYPVQVVADIPDTLPTVLGRSLDLEAIVAHLVDNAVKFAYYHQRDNGRVQVTAQSSDQSVTITVSDNGLGFPEEAIPHLFDIFYQHKRNHYEQQGAGIGLSIVKGLVDLHGGTIAVASEEGAGSQFTVSLPLLQHGRIAEGTPAIMQPSAHVLVVEDDWLLLTGLRELLSMSTGKYAITVSTATNGREALTRLETTTPDLILSDILMPVMDGYELLTAVRDNPAWVHIPFLFLTAKGQPVDRRTGLLSGVDEYIAKPYRASELVGLVEKQLDRHFSRRAARAIDFDQLKRSILTLLPMDFFLPLSSVSNYSDQLTDLDQINTDEELRTALAGIRENSIGLTSLVEDFIALAELHTGEAENAFRFRAQPIYDTALVPHEVCRKCERQARQLGADIQRSHDDNLPPVYGDLMMLTQCMERLGKVGMGYYPSDQRSRISLASEGGPEQVRFVLGFNYPLPTAVGHTIRTILENPSPENTHLSEFAPSLTIVAGYMRLHNGRVLFENQQDHFSFTMVLPVYAPE